jgi:PAS domain-containing protein
MDRQRAHSDGAGLRLILGSGSSGPVAFCGHCGAHPSRALPRAELTRLCERCSIGMILETLPSAAPAEEPFIIVDSTLEIVAISDRAEEIFGIFEQDARGRPVTDFIVDREEPTGRADNFAVAITDTFSSERIELASARLRGSSAGELTLRIASCAPPRAALVVFARSREAGGPHLAVADDNAIV